MSGGYTVRFVGGPMDGETHEVQKLPSALRISVDIWHPPLDSYLGTTYTPGVAVYTLTRTADGGGFYQHCYDEEPIK